MMKIKNLVTLYVGSKLYGLATPTSDVDMYTVYDFLNQGYRPKKQSSQLIEGETDHVKISYEKFLKQVKQGVPQALEVAFAEKEYWLDYSPSWEYCVNELQDMVWDHMSEIFETYRRTVINFMKEDDFKKNRHAFRLMTNARELKLTGRFNPSLDDNEIQSVNSDAGLTWTDRQERYKDLLFKVFG